MRWNYIQQIGDLENKNEFLVSESEKMKQKIKDYEFEVEKNHKDLEIEKNKVNNLL